MKAILSRTYLPNETKGSFYIFNGDIVLFNCKTLELPVLGNQHNISCIPEGIYDVIKYIRPETKTNVFWIKNVPGRSAILIHAGNFAIGKKIDTKGCILPGMNFVDINGDGNLDVVKSIEAMKLLNNYLPDSFKLIIC